MATQAQIDANRRNAQLSTGPKSPPGKLSSRSNSFKHGFSGEGIVVDPEHRAEALNRKAAWMAEIRPSGPTGLFAIERAAAMSLRIEQCENALDALFVEEADRARRDWDQSRTAEAGALAAKLARDPGLTAARLAETKQGVALMLDRWSRLAKSLDLGAWDESDRSAGLDLLGVEPSFRKPGQTQQDAPEASDASAHIRAVIDGQVARLRDRLVSVLEPLDDLARRHAESSVSVLLSKPAALILRYEREATRRFHASMKAAHSSSIDDGTPAPFGTSVPRPDDRPEVDPTIPTAEPAPVAEPKAEASGMGSDYWNKLQAMMLGAGLIAKDEPEVALTDAGADTDADAMPPVVAAPVVRHAPTSIPGTVYTAVAVRQPGVPDPPTAASARAARLRRRDRPRRPPPSTPSRAGPRASRRICSDPGGFVDVGRREEHEGQGEVL